MISMNRRKALTLLGAAAASTTLSAPRNCQQQEDQGRRAALYIALGQLCCL